MSRIIKYRAWDKESRLMREVLNLSFNELGDVSEITVKTGEPYEIPPNASDEDRSVLAGIPCNYGLENFELMQFTGLLDKNGKEIYEGDIVEYSKIGSTAVRVSRVEWISGAFRLGQSGPYLFLHDDLFGKPKVIGNIYENTELLK